jgi:hypothetical protein
MATPCLSSDTHQFRREPKESSQLSHNGQEVVIEGLAPRVVSILGMRAPAGYGDIPYGDTQWAIVPEMVWVSGQYLATSLIPTPPSQLRDLTVNGFVSICQAWYSSHSFLYNYVMSRSRVCTAQEHCWSET